MDERRKKGSTRGLGAGSEASEGMHAVTGSDEREKPRRP